MDVELFTYYICHVEGLYFLAKIGLGNRMDESVRDLHRCHCPNFRQ